MNYLIYKRIIQAGLALSVSTFMSWKVATEYPPAFTGNACAGSGGSEIVAVCGVFPWGFFIPILGVVFTGGILISAYSEYQRGDQ